MSRHLQSHAEDEETHFHHRLHESEVQPGPVPSTSQGRGRGGYAPGGGAGPPRYLDVPPQSGTSGGGRVHYLDGDDGGGGGELHHENDDMAYTRPSLDDPDHRLRIVRTPTETILEVTREDERRRIGKRKRRHTFKKWGSSKLSRGLSFSSSLHKQQQQQQPQQSTIAQGLRQVEHGLGEFGHQVEQQRARQEAEEARQHQKNTRTANQEEEAKAEQFHTPAEEGLDVGKKTDAKAAESRRRRNVYLNIDLPMSDLDKYGQPREYARNKVRTSKYTIWTFVPKNLTEQFRRVANLYFLGLIVLQVFPIFGGTSPAVAMLPLLAILAITAVKDGIEDYRRQQLDEAVNNSAVTRLGDWRNVNVPSYTRGFFAKLFGLRGSSSASVNRSAKVSRGVRKLREKEGAFNADFLYEGGSQQSTFDLMPSSASLPEAGQHINSLSRSSSATNNNTITDVDDYYSSSHNNDSNNKHHSNSTSTDEDEGEGDTTLTSFPMNVGGNRGRSMSYSKSMATSHRTMQRQGVVDYDRPASGTAKWERTLWKKLEVGDVVLLRENDQVPADIVVLSTSDSDGQCFVETKNLDGETNLKPRRALKATMCIQHEEDVEHAQFFVDSEPPHANLYSYNGVLHYTLREEAPGREHPIVEGAPPARAKPCKDAITINELLLRGCALRNTTWVIGLVVYTGDDTKIMLNQGATPSKRSKIEKETNFNVIVNFLILLAMCIACGIANGIYLNSGDTSSDFFEQGIAPSSSNILNAIVTFGACLIVFQNIVPVSLVITVELVKTMQAIFIYQDIDMWYEPLDHPCVPKTWNISDDLGQIEYIFSDKTGTLTQNVMEFKKCSIQGVPYGEGVTEAMLGAAKRDGKDTSAFDPAQNEAAMQRSKADMITLMKQMFKNRYLREDKLTFISPKAVEDLSISKGSTSGQQRQNIIQFFRALAVCHTVLADKYDPDDQNLIEYKAESPDEAALVAAARDFGFVFLTRSNHEIEIEVMGQPERYQPLRVLEFNSSRKRMSVLVRQADGRILMICKGADSVVYQRLRKDHDQALKEKTNRDLEEFANAGLRTLVIAQKYVSEEDYASWVGVYDAACAAVEDREDEIEKACEIIETDLTILGATALEDKLQVGVPDAIAQLHKAGIKLWILTGDKVQTAIEIGFSCNLLSSDMEIMIISSETEDGARSQIEAGLDKIVKAKADTSLAPKEGFAVVIDGETLRFALDARIKPLFLDLTTQCSAVVCCRVSPSQKALTVKLVKDGKKAMTLAIGDGANDVAMIQEAHIGVGIAGLEGAQASMSADYAIGQFRYLTKLLLVHGRWCYIRVAQMHANFFYKNVVWVLAMFWYQFFCNFDGGYLFDYSLILLYNLAFSSLPVIVMGAFDQDINAKVSMAFPELYRRGIKGLEYSRLVFWVYMLDGLYQSAIVIFVPYFIYAYGTSATPQGYDISGQVEFGTTVAAAAVTCVTLFVGLNTSMWTGLMLGVLVVSGLLLYIWVAIYSALPYTFSNLVVILYSTFDFWALIVLVQVIAIGPRFLYKYIQSNYFPIDNNIIREAAYVRGAGRIFLDGSGNVGITGLEQGRDGYAAKFNDETSSNKPTSDPILDILPRLDVQPASSLPMLPDGYQHVGSGSNAGSSQGRRTPSPNPAKAYYETQVEMSDLGRRGSLGGGRGDMANTDASASGPSQYHTADAYEELAIRTDLGTYVGGRRTQVDDSSTPPRTPTSPFSDRSYSSGSALQQQQQHHHLRPPASSYNAHHRVSSGTEGSHATSQYARYSDATSSASLRPSPTASQGGPSFHSPLQSPVTSSPPQEHQEADIRRQAFSSPNSGSNAQQQQQAHGMRREASVASFATAQSGRGYYSGEDDDGGIQSHTGYAR